MSLRGGVDTLTRVMRSRLLTTRIRVHTPLLGIQRSVNHSLILTLPEREEMVVALAFPKATRANIPDRSGFVVGSVWISAPRAPDVEIRLTVREWAFDRSAVQVPAGREARLHFVNAGRLQTSSSSLKQVCACRSPRDRAIQSGSPSADQERTRSAASFRLVVSSPT